MAARVGEWADCVEQGSINGVSMSHGALMRQVGVADVADAVVSQVTALL